MKNSLVIFLSLLSSCCLGQTLIGDTWPVRLNSINLEAGHTQVKDLNLHPKVFNGLRLGAYYERLVKSRTGSLSVDSASGSYFHRQIIMTYSAGFNIEAINTSYEDFPSAAVINLQGNFKYLFPARRRENPIYFIGPAARLQYGTSLYFNWDESHLYYANYISAAIAGRSEIKIADKIFYAGLEIPIVSVICRPIPNRLYKIDDMTFRGVLSTLADNPEFALPDKNFYVGSEIMMEYHTQKYKLREVGARFMYHYMKASDGYPYRYATINISYKFFL